MARLWQDCKLPADTALPGARCQKEIERRMTRNKRRAATRIIQDTRENQAYPTEN